MTSDFEGPCEDLAQALLSLCCGWNTLGYKTGISIILADKKRILELRKGKPDVQAREALEDPGLELEPRQVISKAPTMIPPYLAVAGRLLTESVKISYERISSEAYICVL